MVTLRKDILKYIIIPTIKETGLEKPGAAAIVHGTFMAETNYNALIQFKTPKNGGIGFGQCEPPTYLDHRIWLENGFSKDLLSNVLAACQLASLPRDPMALQWHLRLAVCICRVDYYRAPGAIPTDAEGMSHYHKRYYNSMDGKADPLVNIAHFQKAIEEVHEITG